MAKLPNGNEILGDGSTEVCTGCGGAEHARGNGIPVVVFPNSKSAPEGISTDELLNALRNIRGQKLAFIKCK
uniref:Uncharacterized protein n=1 Tax=Oryza rufipogon TaxID=4529 RepID=A0A0E0QKT3_ORYRU